MLGIRKIPMLFVIYVMSYLLSSQAVAMIAMYGMWMVWGPPHEMGKLLGFNLSGQMFSNIAVFPISALLCKYGFLGGWPSVFYVFGTPLFLRKLLLASQLGLALDYLRMFKFFGSLWPSGYRPVSVSALPAFLAILLELPPMNT